MAPPTVPYSAAAATTEDVPFQPGTEQESLPEAIQSHRSVSSINPETQEREPDLTGKVSKPEKIAFSSNELPKA